MNTDNSPIHWNYRSGDNGNSAWMNAGSVATSTANSSSSSTSSSSAAAAAAAMSLSLKRRNLSESDDCDAYSEDSKDQCSSTATTDSCQMLTRKRRRGIIEKKRRDRINQSLCELKRLVPSAYEKQGSAKLEKAEILQMTVDYLKVLYEKGGAASAAAGCNNGGGGGGGSNGFSTQTTYDQQKLAVEYQTIGFRECANEIARYLVTVEGLDLQDPLRLRLISHLQCYSAQREMASSSAAAAAAAAAASAAATMSMPVTRTSPSPNNCWPYASSGSSGGSGNGNGSNGNGIGSGLQTRDRRRSNESETASLRAPPQLENPTMSATSAAAAAAAAAAASLAPPSLRSYPLNSLEAHQVPNQMVSKAGMSSMARPTDTGAITTSAAILPHINMHDSAGNNYLDISASCTFTVNAQDVLSKIQQPNQQFHKNSQPPSHTNDNSHSLIFAPNLTPLTPVSTGPYSQYFSYQHHSNGNHFQNQNFSNHNSNPAAAASAAAAAQMKPYRPWGGPELAY